MNYPLQNRKICLFFITLLIFNLFFIFYGSAIAFYGPPIPTQNTILSYGYGGYPYPYHMSFSGYESYSNPYMYGPYIGAYPYNAMFNIYSGGYNMNAGYNQASPAAYSSVNFFGSGQQNVNAIGYPYPYAVTDQRLWANQLNYQYGILGAPPVAGSISSSGNPYNIYYDPLAYTFDRGLDAMFTGISNFWKDIFNRLNAEEEN